MTRLFEHLADRLGDVLDFRRERDTRINKSLTKAEFRDLLRTDDHTDHCGDLVRRRRAHGHGGALGDLAGQRPVQRERPPVPAQLGDLAARRRSRSSARAARR